MYEELVKRLRHDSESRALMLEASDAIEELSKRVPPVPHGRLIDADAFEDFIRKDWDKNDHWIADVVYSRPTIIPAEEEA